MKTYNSKKLLKILNKNGQQDKRSRRQAYLQRQVAKNTGYTKRKSKEKRIFIVKNDLEGKSIERFAPSFEIAKSWNRIMNDNIKKHDLTLLKHEMYEEKLIANELIQEQAPKLASEKYNYKKSGEYYAKIKKRNKKG